MCASRPFTPAYERYRVASRAYTPPPRAGRPVKYPVRIWVWHVINSLKCRGAAKAAEKRPRHEVVQCRSAARSEEDLGQLRQAVEKAKDKKNSLRRPEIRYVFIRKMIVKSTRPSHVCFTPPFDGFTV